MATTKVKKVALSPEASLKGMILRKRVRLVKIQAEVSTVEAELEQLEFREYKLQKSK